MVRFSLPAYLLTTDASTVEPGKGRKCVILVGRPREVYKMSWNELRQAGGLGDSEFWTKLSPEGMVLSSAASVQNVLGFLPDEMGSSSFFAPWDSADSVQQSVHHSTSS